ncbi:hypothetical protein ELQ87_23865 [Streptomyces griseoviridis]|uniref:Uncharacterized protein n=1 Tax=Streptomyces griseoviridis TaxID=45398 RepID=A0A3S9ZGR6_STRGD|nr:MULTISPECIES: hypothetical protein [Streptomyces]AZS86953.1 hypothetical protein ELQ87_23865 [Streptomyces griseoviridis]MDH6702151.1 hypothetical protein [Streptomyces sp. MAA16]QCN86192.1 hypothetical protein DDJ31_15405 [Streptomyces griseoviridis]
MTVLLEVPGTTKYRDPRTLLNAVRPHVKERRYNIFEAPGSEGVDLWEREVRLLLRDSVAVRSLAERVLGQAVAYLVTAVENPGADMGPGFTVDLGIHQIILDTPVYFAFCDLYNGGRYKHHAPLVERRRDGTVMRTADLIGRAGFAVDIELWEVDAADCGPCDDKVPDSH